MALLKIKSLEKSYGKADIFRGIDLTVEQGEVLGLTWPTGSGKTTLLRLINLPDEPSTGSILFNGSEISRRPDKEKIAARRKMAMVFQNFGLRIRGGVDAEVMRKRTVDVMAAVGLSGCERPDANTQSHGETQRIALARALIPDRVAVLQASKMTAQGKEEEIFRERAPAQSGTLNFGICVPW